MAMCVECFRHPSNTAPLLRLPQVARKEVVQVVVRDGTRLPISPWVSPQISALIRSCWEDDPRKRPTMRQVVSRLESIDKWDTDGRLWRAAAGLEPLPPVPPSPSPRLSVPRTSGGTGLYVAGPLGRIEPGRPGSRVAAVIATAGAGTRGERGRRMALLLCACNPVAVVACSDASCQHCCSLQ